MGGCCGRGTRPAQEYVYTAPDGTKKVYRAEIEARAAVIRSGGSYTTKQK